MEQKKYLTKSAFKIALSCPHKLYYYGRPDEYENANANDEFLESLAEGGFQVGELAKIYCDVPDDCDLKDIMGHEESLLRTQELMQRDQVNIAEAAFCFDNLFVRVDILKKNGNHIELIEVKAKSWNPETNSFEGSRPKGCVASDIRPYLYDVAFQKYVVCKALKEQHPDRYFCVEARLMMADKRRKADIDGLNQLFKIQRNEQERAEAIIVKGAREKIKKSKVKVLTAFDVDDLCNRIVDGQTSEQDPQKTGNYTCEGLRFVPFLEKAASYYCSGQPYPGKPMLGGKCFKCEFHCTSDDDKKDGKLQCWTQYVTEKDLREFPLIASLNGFGLQKRGNWVTEGKYFLKDLTEDEIKPFDSKKAQEPGLDLYQRKWLQIGLETKNDAILSRFKEYLNGNIYLDVDGLREEMAKWNYPLHMIDFETTAVALPYYIGMKPYEQVAFQFSHHIIYEDGRIEHAGQYLNEDVKKFPNFEFVRELRRQLSQDQGTIFRYATHENSILRTIAGQLADRNEPDKGDLIDFIRSITHNHDEKKGELYDGPRDMVDLLQVVKRYFYQLDEMHGSNSIKQVLPAVLNSSQYLKDKYSQPIYGSVIPSCNISASQPKAWITLDANGHVESPYHQLDSVGALIGMSEEDMDQMEQLSTDEKDFEVANGGAALTAYNKLMFCEGESMNDALRQALLRYCELDTMSMVFIWEYFHDMVTKKK